MMEKLNTKLFDHTILKADATKEAVLKVCREAKEYNFMSVCVNGFYTALVKKELEGTDVKVSTVVGFPLGQMSTTAKATEAAIAVEDGADEIDMVINISDVKNGDYDKVEQEIIALKAECGNRILKVIVETCYLTEEEKIAMCQAVTNAGADYIKTSTGFGTGGATLGDVKLFREHIGEAVRIKAAGGVSTREDFEAFLDAGCDRIGSSSGVALLTKKA